MRIFFGATLPDETKKAIVELQKSIGSEVADAKFEGEGKLHITLQFIGDYPERGVEELYSSADVELHSSAVKSQLTSIVGMSFFPNADVRRGVWLECLDGGALSRLAGIIRTVSQEFGIVSERRTFKPHITIARIKATSDRRRQRNSFGGYRGDGTPQNEGDLHKFIGEGKLSMEQFFPRSVALFESTLKPSGSEYRILHEYSLEQSEKGSTR